MKLQIHCIKLQHILLLLLVIIGGRQCYGDTVSIPFRYYHSDHSGSASWITNGNGTPVQHLQYMPYGEPLVNERATGYEERYTFTGKERDSETGFSYFGARYYDSDILTGWLSVDPMEAYMLFGEFVDGYVAESTFDKYIELEGMYPSKFSELRKQRSERWNSIYDEWKIISENDYLMPDSGDVLDI